jgi:hypothetical protein
MRRAARLADPVFPSRLPAEVCSNGEHPGMKLTELTQKLFYGRTG